MSSGGNPPGAPFEGVAAHHLLDLGADGLEQLDQLGAGPRRARRGRRRRRPAPAAPSPRPGARRGTASGDDAAGWRLARASAAGRRVAAGATGGAAAAGERPRRRGRRRCSAERARRPIVAGAHSSPSVPFSSERDSASSAEVVGELLLLLLGHLGVGDEAVLEAAERGEVLVELGELLADLRQQLGIGLLAAPGRAGRPAPPSPRRWPGSRTGRCPSSDPPRRTASRRARRPPRSAPGRRR